jgi:hypothetical protein
MTPRVPTEPPARGHPIPRRGTLPRALSCVPQPPTRTQPLFTINQTPATIRQMSATSGVPSHECSSSAVPHRKPIRLPGYDYAQPGTYFVTICTYRNRCLFGDVVDDTLHLSDFGHIAREEWLRSARIRPRITLDAFAVMPNHLPVRHKRRACGHAAACPYSWTVRTAHTGFNPHDCSRIQGVCHIPHQHNSLCARSTRLAERLLRGGGSQ